MKWRKKTPDLPMVFSEGIIVSNGLYDVYLMLIAGLDNRPSFRDM